ncbi:unnamed protein product, partial [Symbiodinium natans]
DIQRSYKRLESLPVKAPEADTASLQTNYEVLAAQLASEVALRKTADARLQRIEARLLQDRNERAQRIASVKAGVDQ